MKDRFKKFNSVAAVILVVLLGASLYLIYQIGDKGLILKKNQSAKSAQNLTANLADKVAPEQGIELPVKWGDMGKQMITAGVINQKQFEDLYAQRNNFTDADKKLIESADNGNIVITSRNSGLMLNLLWALGLGNRNDVLEKGPMMNPQYGGAKNFASTGGWTLSKGDTMSHYSNHQFIVLTAEQQQLVEKAVKNIYRPCCGNSTYFPDCNHGMAMLGFLELAASQGFDENALYQMALVLNSYWFSENYTTIAQYMDNQGIDWANVDAKEVLGQNFSSSAGYQKILSQVQPKQGGGGGSCGV